MNKNKILIIGKGYIGSRIHKDLKCPITSKKIYCYKDILSINKKYKPKAIINCIGLASTDETDKSPERINNKLYTNSFLPILLGEASLRLKFKLIHISSGCIYSTNYSKQGIQEDKIPDYYDLFYSRSKIYSENALIGLSKIANILIARIRLPLDTIPHEKNLLTKLIKYKNVISVKNSVTYIPDFIKAIKHLIKKDATGAYNINLKDPLSYPHLLNTYKKYKPNYTFKLTNLKNLQLIRPNLTLSTKKLEKTGLKVRRSKEIIEECVKEYTKY